MSGFSYPPQHRSIFCNRTLNMRSIKAIGYDMDYTLIHYKEDEWEKRAYEYLRKKLLAQGFPVEGLSFDSMMMTRGLVIDIEKGNILKTNRFGYVKQAYHGTKALDYKVVQDIYSRNIISLVEDKFIFLNTLFSLSEGCMYAQLVDLLDQHKLPDVVGYNDLYAVVKRSLDAAHMEGELKAEIVGNPDRFVLLDSDTPLALLDQKNAGKKLILITNSEYFYTDAMMKYAFDRFLPGSMGWRDLFEIVIVSARKPDFFSNQPPVFEVVDDKGLLNPVIDGLKKGKVYFGGNAKLVEGYLSLSGDEILYVGDHLFTDVHVSKNILRWRTGLVLRELENEIIESNEFRESQKTLMSLMETKKRLEFNVGQLKLRQLRLEHNCLIDSNDTDIENIDIEEEIKNAKEEIQRVDQKIIPLVEESSKLGHPRWGLMMQAGNDKSLFARQLERYADIYMSRVSNFLYQSPYIYLRSPRGCLPHDVFREM